MNSTIKTSNLQKELNIYLTPKESFAAIMLCAVSVDGHMAETELQNLMTTLQRTKLFKDKTKASIINTLNKLLRIIKTYDVDTLLQLALPNLPEYLNETVFALATDITLADGAMFEEELSMLSKLSDCLSIPEDKVDRITEVIMIKNKG
ncbi:tellurite resistance TerB family protein [Waterburya agarophytonicola K14]|uniref:Tellurite resistance TerB family protein n=1 Tax=Waterburya agarophytonicola KI4 TaxID=2874699 RepID=A0A964FG98_9CYAN|nr:tellurite resistance TerB family protein [Waterburya agarophytonicola]MCC0176323.1 tellurite resistance TerB family protein [Waterburya agarophytonicola KI4]